MYSFMVFLLPSLLGLKIFIHLTKQSKYIEIIQTYGLLVLFSNMLCMLILMFTGKGEYNLIEYAKSNYMFCFKYICMMIIINIFISFVFFVVDKYFVFEVEVKNEKKNNIKNS